MVHFHMLEVKMISKETQDCVSVTFKVPTNLEPLFTYKEGQNITLRTTIEGKEVRRSYSICAAPYENLLKVAIKKVDGGLFSGWANDQLKIGDKVDVMPPVGKFTTKADRTGGNYLGIAAGSGITPVIGIIKHVLFTDAKSKFTLIYGNRTKSSILFFEELEGLKNKYVDRFTLIHVLSGEPMDAPINAGRINAEKLEAFGQLIPYETFNDVYVCGPEQMIFGAISFLKDKGLSEASIHYELFTMPGQGVVAKKKDVAEQQGESNILIQLDGRTVQFNLSYDGPSILDAALKKGADLPFACKGGVCCTCRAKLVEGEVEMLVNYALEQEEVDRGFILTCQSHPRSQRVLIDFDVR